VSLESGNHALDRDELAFVHFTFATFELVMPIDRSSEFLFDDHLHMG